MDTTTMPPHLGMASQFSASDLLAESDADFISIGQEMYAK
jgi:hypothetical protein